MKKNMTLLIMAAGMGSRFGGLKQIEPVGPHGEFIIDYSIYDAIKAGFNKVVFIIKEENYETFKETIGNRIQNYIDVSYCFQKLEDLPDGYNVPEGRVKPWGTAHAILSAKNLIHENFAIINADDFYGRDAFKVIGEFLQKHENSKLNQFAVVGYEVANTLTENGSVKRGVCEVKNGYLTKLIESSVEKIENKIIASPLDGSASFSISSDTRVSMNMFGFTKEIFNYIDSNFVPFLQVNKDNIEKCEYLIPNIVCQAVNEDFATVQVLETCAKWQGVTYKEDTEKVVKEISKMVDAGIYPKKLWN